MVAAPVLTVAAAAAAAVPYWLTYCPRLSSTNKGVNSWYSQGHWRKLDRRLNEPCKGSFLTLYPEGLPEENTLEERRLRANGDPLRTPLVHIKRPGLQTAVWRSRLSSLNPAHIYHIFIILQVELLCVLFEHLNSIARNVGATAHT